MLTMWDSPLYLLIEMLNLASISGLKYPKNAPDSIVFSLCKPIILPEITCEM